MRSARRAAVVGFLAVFAVGLCGAQVLTVTTPTDGSFLGLTNQLKFTVTNANVEVTITADVTGPGGTTTISDRFTPNADGKIDSQLALNFSESSPIGPYSIEVTGKRNDNNVVFGSATINVTVDVLRPKFLQFNPIPNSYVKGIVPIRVEVLEPNFKDFRVQINGQDIPNNTGTSLVDGGFTVNWDTSGIVFDGSQSISIRLRDLASNEDTRSISVAVDRVPPAITIVLPNPNIRLRPRSNVTVAIDITDSTGTSVDMTGVDVVARTLGGDFIARVARSSFRSTGGNTSRWSGRLRFSDRIPKEFKIVVSVTDKAGNVGATQEVIVKYR